MTTIAANQTISPRHPSPNESQKGQDRPRGSDRPTCTVCADTMVAAEASAFASDNVVSYLWTCDTCGYGFVTKHRMQRIVCN